MAVAEPVVLGPKPVQDLRTLHPRHGPHGSVAGSPARRVGSVRRTSTVDTHRPHGLHGYTLQRGRARDLLTTGAGAQVVGEGRLELTLEYDEGPTVMSASSTPAAAGLEGLIGLKASTGFRQRAIELVDVERGSPLFLLIDEVPAATLVSGHALAHANVRGDLEFPAQKRGPRLQYVDLCAGFTADGTIMTEVTGEGLGPITTGPEAPLVVDEDDPEGWHELEVLDVDSMRRMRRLDLWRREDGLLEADVFFRDSHQNPWGVEQVVHEYGIRALVDESSMSFVRAQAEEHSLPFLECPRAAASAERLVGMPLAGLRSAIREQFIGPSTCTHLNDMMRSLEDLPHLAALLQS
jgi:hypothetical protein